jgi:hypothetical protein
LGLGDVSSSEISPTLIPFFQNQPIQSVCCGEEFTIACCGEFSCNEIIDSFDSMVLSISPSFFVETGVFSLGLGSSGQLGHGSFSVASYPTLIQSLKSRKIAVE